MLLQNIGRQYESAASMTYLGQHDHAILEVVCFSDPGDVTHKQNVMASLSALTWHHNQHPAFAEEQQPLFGQKCNGKGM